MIAITPNWKDLKLINQCGVCIYYMPHYKKDQLTAHGGCTLKDGLYKQRTESCLKYKPISGGTKYVESSIFNRSNQDH